MDPDNPWIACTNRGSMLCAKIHGLSEQIVHPRFAQYKVRCHKLKGQAAIAERDCNRPHKATLGIRIRVRDPWIVFEKRGTTVCAGQTMDCPASNLCAQQAIEMKRVVFESWFGNPPKKNRN